MKGQMYPFSFVWVARMGGPRRAQLASTVGVIRDRIHMKLNLYGQILVLALGISLWLAMDLWAEESLESEVAENQEESKEKSNTSFESSVSLSGEYDDNVYKTLGSGVASDFGTRLFFSSSFNLDLDKNEKLNIKYLGGGKKYLEETDQDSLINNLQIDYSSLLSESYFLGVTNSFKNKIERAVGDEDYLLNYLDLLAGFFKSDVLFNTYLNSRYTFFYYDFTPAYSFHSGQYGVGLKSNIIPKIFTHELAYYFQHQYFLEALPNYDKRRDLKHEVSNLLQFDKIFLGKIGYAYQFNDSNIDSLIYHNHRVIFQLSKILFYNITVLFYGTIQYKVYNEGSLYDEESERSLLTESEDEFFNSMIIKVSKDITPNLSLDLKYSRFSDELSRDTDQYERNVYNVGLRLEF